MLSTFSDNSSIFIRTFDPNAPEDATQASQAASTNDVEVGSIDAPPPPMFNASAYAPVAASGAGSKSSTMPTDLLSEIHKGTQLKQAKVESTKNDAVPTSGSGLSGLLSMALANRRTNMEDTGRRKHQRADSWDEF